MTSRHGRERTARWEAAARAATMIGDETKPAVLGAKALEQVLDVLGAEVGVVYTLAPTGHGLELLAERGMPGGFEDERTGLRQAILSAGTRSMSTREIVSGDESDESVETEHGHDRYEIVAAPLSARSKCVGAIAVAKHPPAAFDLSERAILKLLAHELASALLTGDLQPEHRLSATFHALDEATLAITAEIEPRRVLQVILERAREITGARYAALGIGTDANRQFEPWLFSGLDEELALRIGRQPRPVGLLGAVPKEGKIIRMRDLMADPRFRGWPPHHPPMRSFLGAPIRWRGEGIGNLYLSDKIGAAEFTADDERAVSLLAAHAAIAYRHAQLFAEAQLQRNRLQAVVASSPLGIIFIEKDTGYAYANRAAEELFGRPLAPSGGSAQYLAEFRRADGQLLSTAEIPSNRALAGEQVIGTEMSLKRPDGSELSVLVNAAPIRDGEGKVTGAVVLWQDVTPLKLERLREEFISVVAHELRTPITVISGYADMLARGQQGEPARRAIESIRVSTKRLDRLVRDLLDASRIEAQRLELELRPVALDELVQDVVERTKEMLGGHSVHVLVPRKTPRVQADAGRIEQVLTNLLTNAAKYSASQSTIEIAVEARDTEVAVSVTNEGPGIPAEDVPRLFTRFYRTTTARKGGAQGIGLGLHVARGLVEAHGGRISAISNPGEKTTFCFVLPVVTVPTTSRIERK